MKTGVALELELAGLPPLRLEGEDRRWLEALAPRYGAFARSLALQEPLHPESRLSDTAPCAATRRLLLRATAPPPDLAAVARFLAEPVVVETQPAGWTLSTSWCRVVFDRRTGSGEIAGPLHRAAIDLAVRHLLNEDLRDGLLLHGALLADGGRTFLCAGPSGCGKSTLAKLLPQAALCDELAVVRRTADGRWRAWSLPFWNGRPGSGSLESVYLLEHGACSERRPLARTEALRRLAPEVIWPEHDALAAGQALDLLAGLVAEVPVATLAFRPEPAVWDWIAAAAA